jgi:hypothetical protein
VDTLHVEKNFLVGISYLDIEDIFVSLLRRGLIYFHTFGPLSHTYLMSSSVHKRAEQAGRTTIIKASPTVVIYWLCVKKIANIARER